MKEGLVKQKIREEFFTISVIKKWNRLLSCGLFLTDQGQTVWVFEQLDLVKGGKVPLPMAGGLE